MLTELKYNGILEDLTFKYLFSEVKFLEDFINSYFEYTKEDKKFYFSNIEAHSIIKAPIRDLKNYYEDIIATINTGEIINIEAYKTFGSREYHKSLNYLCRIYSNQIKEGEKKYENCKKVININLVQNISKSISKSFISKFEFQDSIKHIVLEEGQIEMILVRLDKVDCINYNQNETRFIRWIKLINAKSIEESELISKGDKIMEQSVEYVKRYLNGPLNHTMEDYILEKQLEAEEKSLFSTAKKLLNLNIDIKTISKATGLSEKEIMELKE